MVIRLLCVSYIIYHKCPKTTKNNFSKKLKKHNVNKMTYRIADETYRWTDTQTDRMPKQYKKNVD